NEEDVQVGDVLGLQALDRPRPGEAAQERHADEQDDQEEDDGSEPHDPRRQGEHTASLRGGAGSRGYPGAVTPTGPAPAHDSIGDAVRAHVPMVATGAVAFIAFDGAAALRGDASAASYAVVMAILFVVVATADRWVGFTTPLLWCMVAWATLHMAGGLVVTGP